MTGFTFSMPIPKLTFVRRAAPLSPSAHRLARNRTNRLLLILSFGGLLVGALWAKFHGHLLSEYSDCHTLLVKRGGTYSGTF